MTFEPPPPPPGEPPYGSQPPPPPPPPPYGTSPPPQYGAPVPSVPPPPQQWGTPPPAPQWGTPPPVPGGQPPWGTPGMRGPSASFNPATVNPLDWGIMAAGFLALLFSFFDYYTYDLRFLGVSRSYSWSAWHGFFGWFAALVALAAAGVLAVSIFAPQVQIPFASRLITLGGFALATLCVLFAWFVDPGGIDQLSRGFGFYSSLIVIIAGLVLSFLRLRATGGKLPWEPGGTPLQGGSGPYGPPPGRYPSQ